MDKSGGKRHLPRWLCDPDFKVSVLIDGHHYDTVALNYNHVGMGLFRYERLPEASQCTVSLSYNSDPIQLKDELIPATIVYANETEVGSHYGLKFNLETVGTRLLLALQEVDRLLGERENHSDRYGVNS
ncbi:hypothetical protein [Pseudomaricurvus sp. HS19]|uniref:hypothetical protein n=1 Tax=Pseudomaricurvus sp. HS19 TaxID=2692626 RepID=UPI00136F2E23|nr:hypothetical protein [Pseudomaricurvus sp. HS19]MYM63758.1 hypothetical protein [Pseudomaricurvus sp. HS19]